MGNSIYIKKSTKIDSIFLSKDSIFEYGSLEKDNFSTSIKRYPNTENNSNLSSVLCEIIMSFSVNPKNKQVFEGIKVQGFINKKEDFKGSTTVKIKGQKFTLPEVNYFPQHFQDFISKSQEELTKKFKIIIQNFRWVYDHEPIHKTNYYSSYAWSFNLKNWYPLPDGIYASANVVNTSNLSEVKNQIIKDLVNKEKNVPEYHIILSEAKKLFPTSPRSSIVIAVTALEVATKHCVQHIAPQTEWLLMNIQSPPILKIWEDYITLITTDITYKGHKVKINERLLKDLKKAVFIRNGIVHEGDKPNKIDSLKRMHVTIKDLLHMIDFYCGHTWALEYLSDQTKDEILKNEN